MTKISRYIIVLDRYDDDDHHQDEVDGHGLNDGTEEGGCAQVAAELQEAMESTGQPAGFFNVIAREVFQSDATHQNVSTVEPDLLRPGVASMLTRERNQA